MANAHVELTIHDHNSNTTDIPKQSQQDDDDFAVSSQRGQWLRAAVLGANDGLVTTASLMMGIGAVKNDVKAMILAGFAGLVAGACSMAIGEFVSVYTQLDIELAQLKREKNKRSQYDSTIEAVISDERMQLPSPLQAATASALAFSVGAVAPLLAAAFIDEHKMRLIAVVVATTVALVVFGAVGAVMGRTSVWRSSVRVLLGGWMAMAITFGMTKLIGSTGI